MTPEIFALWPVGKQRHMHHANADSAEDYYRIKLWLHFLSQQRLLSVLSIMLTLRRLETYFRNTVTSDRLTFRAVLRTLKLGRWVA